MIRNKIRIPTFTTAYSTWYWNFMTEQLHKKNKRHQIVKEKIKISLFTDYIMLQVKKIKELTRKLIELINLTQQICRLQDQHTKIYVSIET